MAIRITEDGTVIYENEPCVNRELFPNLPGGYATTEQISQAVNEWLEDHPEATTTVEDGSITREKLDSELNTYLDSVDTDISSLNEDITTIKDLASVYEPALTQNSIDVSEYAGERIGKVTSEISVSTAAETFELFCCGKNHVKLEANSGGVNGFTWVADPDGTITLNGTADRNYQIPISQVLCVYNAPWRSSIQKSAENENVYQFFNGRQAEDVFTRVGSPTAYAKQVYLFVAKNAVCDNLVVRPMIEFGDYDETVTYEQFKGFVLSHTFESAVTSGSIDWGGVDIPVGADTMWMYDADNMTTVYDAVGVRVTVEALAEEVESFSSAIDEAYAHDYSAVVNGWDDVAVTYENGLINSDGGVTSNSSFRHSNYIPCKEGDRIDYNLYGYSSTVYIVTFYNASQTRLSGTVGMTGFKSGSVVAPENTAYVVFCSSNAYAGEFTISELVKVSGDTSVANLKALIDSKTSVQQTGVVLNRSNIGTIEGNIYSNQGFYNLASGRRTDYIPVSTGDVINYRAYAYIGASVKTYTVACFDSTKARLEFVQGEETGYVSGTYTVPADGAYIIISWTTSMQYDAWFEIQAATVTQELADYVASMGKIPPSPLNGKQWCCLGDSITYGANTTKTYAGYIAERCGITPYNFGVSNTAIAKSSASTTNNMESRFSDMFDGVDYVTVFGGTNDHGQNIPIGQWGDAEATTLYGAMKILIEGLINKYPGKKIGFILPLPKYDTTHSVDYSYPSASFYPYIQCIEDVCRRYSIPTCNLYFDSGLSPSISAVRTAMIPDGLHPNAAGHELISYKIQRFLESL